MEVEVRVAVVEHYLEGNRRVYKKWSDKHDIVHIINGVIILRPGKYLIDFSGSMKTQLYSIGDRHPNDSDVNDVLVTTDDHVDLNLSVKMKYMIKHSINNLEIHGKNYMTITKYIETKLEDEYTII